MTLGRAFGWLCICATAALGCSAKTLPPGTPAPEYEERSFEPWPPDAGAPPAQTSPSEPGSADAGAALPAGGEPPADASVGQ